jgi:hypothetical protein
MIQPLQIKGTSPRRVVFSASEEARKTSVPPPLVSIGEASLFVAPGPPKAPGR